MDPQTKTSVDRGGRAARAADDGRHRRAGALVRAAAHARELEDAVAWAAERELADRSVGLGSNLLAADDGRRGARRPARRRARAGRDRRASCSSQAAGAANAVCLHRARDARVWAGSSSRARSPGTAGGGVRMNAGAYGSDWSRGARRARSSSIRREPAGSRATSSSSATGTRRCGRDRSSRRSSSGSRRGRRRM